MDKETLIRLVTPSSILALAISIMTLQLILKAYGEKVKIDEVLSVMSWDDLKVQVIEMP